MADESWRLVEHYGLRTYPNGIEAGSRVRLRSDIRVKDLKGRATGKVYAQGEVWTVLPGVGDEPDVIWLRQADGERHTWDCASFFEAFEVIDAR